MDRVCCIVDFEGFKVNNQFLVRELGWIDMENAEKDSVRFDLRGYHRSLQDIENCNYITSKVSGLTFKPMRGEETTSPQLLDFKLREIYDFCKTSKKNVIAYLGGKTERNILSHLGIPCINLDAYCCPKSDRQVSFYPLYIYPACGNHKYNGHCPFSEVQALRAWVLARL
nr:uncharacterized protein LOC107438300 [Parasteatoda tepidariorum]